MLREAGGQLLAYCVDYDPPNTTPEFLQYLTMHLSLLIPKLHRLDFKRACTHPEVAQDIAALVDRIMEKVLVRSYLVSCGVVLISYFLDRRWPTTSVPSLTALAFPPI